MLTLWLPALTSSSRYSKSDSISQINVASAEGLHLTLPLQQQFTPTGEKNHPTQCAFEAVCKCVKAPSQ